MSFKEFSELYKTLVTSRQIAKDFNNETWFNNCVKVHSPLLEIIKDKTIEIDSQLEGTKGVPPERAIGPKIDKVLEIVPHYLSKYGISRDNLKSPMLKSPRRIRTAKHIMGYTKREEVDPHKTLELSKLVSEMGQIWEDSKDHCETEKIIFSIDPRAFIHIGCGGLNGGSCWRTGLSAKFAFGSIKNSFCFYISTDKNPDPLNPEILWGYKEAQYTSMYHMRGIGWVDIENKTILLSNTYGKREKTSFTYLSSLLPEMYRKIFPTKKEVFTFDNGTGTRYDGKKIMTYLNQTYISASTDKKKDGEFIFKNFWEEPPTRQELDKLKGK